MKRKITQTKYFSKALNGLLKKRQILEEDFEDFQEELAKNPEMGDIIPGTNGVRKARLKSASRGKSSGSRICYYDITSRNQIYLLLIYAKNQQEDITAEDKKDFKELVNVLRKDSR